MINPYYDLNLPVLYRRIRESTWSGEWVIHRKSPGDWCWSYGPDDPHGGAEIIAVAVVQR